MLMRRKTTELVNASIITNRWVSLIWRTIRWSWSILRFYQRRPEPWRAGESGAVAAAAAFTALTQIRDYPLISRETLPPLTASGARHWLDVISVWHSEPARSVFGGFHHIRSPPEIQFPSVAAAAWGRDAAAAELNLLASVRLRCHLWLYLRNRRRAEDYLTQTFTLS